MLLTDCMLKAVLMCAVAVASDKVFFDVSNYVLVDVIKIVICKFRCQM